MKQNIFTNHLHLLATSAFMPWRTNLVLHNANICRFDGQTMGKEANLLEAARVGNLDVIRSCVRKLKSSTSHRTHKKRTTLRSTQSHSYKRGFVTHR